MTHALSIMAALSRLDAEEIHATEPTFLLEKGKVPAGVLMVMSGKVKLKYAPTEPEVPHASQRRIWAVKEVWSESPFPFWLSAVPGSVYRVIPREAFMALLREKPHLRLEVMQMLCSELGLIGGHVTA